MPINLGRTRRRANVANRPGALERTKQALLKRTTNPTRAQEHADDEEKYHRQWPGQSGNRREVMCATPGCGHSSWDHDGPNGICIDNMDCKCQRMTRPVSEAALTRKQLRRIIDETLTEASSAGFIINELTEWIANTIANHVGANHGEIARDAVEAVEEALGDDVPVPARFEDVEPLAERLSNHVCDVLSDRMQREVQDVCRLALTDLMHPKKAKR